MLRFLAFTLLLSLAACGPKAQPALSTREHADEMHGEHHDHAAMPPAVARFHEKLSPLWHAPKSADRVGNACSATAELDLLLADVEAEGPPAGVDPTSWGTAVADLRGAWATFRDDCTNNDAAEFENAFGLAHDRFHALVELLPKSAP